MGTFSEDIKARYEQSETETDAFGRAIVVKRLRPHEDFSVRRLVASDTGNVNLQMMVAASVRSVDGKAMFVPKNQNDIDVLLDVLDAEGMEAAVNAYARLMGLKKVEDQGAEVEPPESVEDKAKNS